MSQRWQTYLTGQEPLPETILSWPLRGPGLENLGLNGQPVEEALPACGPDELLVRVDAVGLCASDAKMIRLGSQYPLFYGRDLARQPTRLGHEVALTVIRVGERWQADYRPGQRLGLQPDVFIRGRRSCFGVLIPGGLTQYLALGPDVLAGDAGSYVFTIPPELSYADIALLEPWACVDAAYMPRRRLEPKAGGTMWIKGRPGDSRPYRFSRPLTSARVVLSHVPPALATWLQTQPVELIEWNEPDEALLIEQVTDDCGFDDIILLDPGEAAMVAAAADRLAPQGTLTIVADQPLDEPVPVDIGRIHYEFIAYLGCTGPDIAAAFGPERNRSELRPGGLAWIAGAGGPMGRMHLQRALQMAEGPRTVIVTNRGEARLADLLGRFTPLAEAHGRQLIGLNPQAEPERLAQIIDRESGGRGCDDIVVMVPDLELAAEAVRRLAVDGLLAFFAGVPLGHKLPLPLSNGFLHGAQFTGTSGSELADQLRIIEKCQAGQLSPAHSVAAIGGLKAAGAGLRAVMERTYPGKIVIFPQLPDLPLLDLSELRSTLPELYAQLGPGESWTAQAEQILFKRYL
jgi:threonine dehydrogenase-like Zn-dependent dehydrogenase